MDLSILRTHQDRVVTALDSWPEIEQEIALNYLRAKFNLTFEQCSRAIEKLYRQEMKGESS